MTTAPHSLQFTSHGYRCLFGAAPQTRYRRVGRVRARFHAASPAAGLVVALSPSAGIRSVSRPPRRPITGPSFWFETNPSRRHATPVVRILGPLWCTGVALPRRRQLTSADTDHRQAGAGPLRDQFGPSDLARGIPPYGTPCRTARSLSRRASGGSLDSSGIPKGRAAFSPRIAFLKQSHDHRRV